MNRKLAFEWTCFVSTDEKLPYVDDQKGGFINVTPLARVFRLLQLLGAAAIEEKITKNRKLHCQRHHGAESDYLDDIRI